MRVNKLNDIERQVSACWATIKGLISESEKTETKEWKLTDQMTPPENIENN